MVRGEIKIALKVERIKMIGRNLKALCNIDIGILKAKSAEYKIKLINRFQDLQEDVDDINDLNAMVVDIIIGMAEGKAQISVKISEDTKLL